jgi:hypothetical protein
MSYTLVWASTDELGCIRVSMAPVPELDQLVDIMVEGGVFPCDALVFQGEPIFDRWDKDLNNKFNATYSAVRAEGERREYERLKAKYEPSAVASEP